MRSAVSADRRSGLLNANDTAALLTPASHATSARRNRPVAELVPLPPGGIDAARPRPRFAPLVVDTGGLSLTDALLELRGDE